MRLWRRRPPVIPGAEVGKLRDETSVDAETGAVTSRQAGDIVLPAEAIEGLWDPEHLERVARTYWTTLQRFTLGLMHVALHADRALGRPPDPAAAAAHLQGARIRDGRLPGDRAVADREGAAGVQARARAATATWRSTSAATTNRSAARCG